MVGVTIATIGTRIIIGWGDERPCGFLLVLAVNLVRFVGDVAQNLDIIHRHPRQHPGFHLIIPWFLVHIPIGANHTVGTRRWVLAEV